MMPLGLGAALLLVAVMAEATPPLGPPSTTVAPTDAPYLASPLVGVDAGMDVQVSSPPPSPALPLASPLAPSSGRSTPRTPLSTRLSVVKAYATWSPYPPAPTLTPTHTPYIGVATTPAIVRPSRIPTAMRAPSRSLRRYRTADVEAEYRRPAYTDATAVISSPTPASAVAADGHANIPVLRAHNGSSRPTSLSPVGLGHTKPSRDDRGGRAVWTGATANAASADDASEYYRRYYASPSAPASNASWWSAMQTGLPALGQGLGLTSALRRVGHHHHHAHKPFVAAHWEDPDYGDSAGGGSQVVALAHPHPHQHQHQHQPVYYVEPQKKEDTWSDLTTKLIVLAVIKLLIVKALGLGAFKLLVIGLIKIPIAFAAFALKFAVVVKFFKFIKVFLAVLVIPILVIAVVPLLLPILIPLGLLIIPLLLIPLLLLFPVPVLTPGTNGGGTVITITPGRRRREEEEQALAQLESRVADSRRCLQKMACDVGYRSQAVKGYADWIMWMLGLIKPILGDTKRTQLKSFISAYKAGLVGRSCYRKYPCYANNMNTKRGKGKGASRGADVNANDNDSTARNDDTVNNNKNGTTIIINGVGSLTGSNHNNGSFTATMKAAEVDGGSGSSSSSVEERILYDLGSASSTNNTSAFD